MPRDDGYSARPSNSEGSPLSHSPIRTGPRPEVPRAPAGEHPHGPPTSGADAPNPLAAAFEAVEAFPALRESQAGLVILLDAGVEDRGAIVAAIGSDLGLAVPVLRAAARHAGPAPASIAAAVGALEPAEVRAICEAVPTYDVLGPPGRWFDAPYRYLRHVVAVQRSVRRISTVLGRPDGEVLATAALLHDVGKLALGHAVGHAGEPFADRRAPEARSGQAPSGIDDAAVGAVLLRRWGLPRALWSPVERHHSDDPDPAAAILRLADLVARHDRGHGVARAALLRTAESAGVGSDVVRGLLYDQAGVVVVPLDGAPCPLTPAELGALRGLARGLRYKEIASELGVQASTIGSHLHKVYAKTGTVDRAQAVLLATERGWLDD